MIQSTPDFKTHLQVEKEASKLHTHTHLVYDVHDGIFASLYHCCSIHVQQDDTSSTYVIHDIEVDYKIQGLSLEVTYEVT